MPEWLTQLKRDAAKFPQIGDGMSFGTDFKEQANGTRMLFANYSTQGKELRVFIQKVERVGMETVVSVKDYTPHHGRAYQLRHSYRTAAEMQNAPHSPGINPWAGFAGADTDPIFHNVSWSGVQAILGEILQNENALMGILAVSEVRHERVEVKKKGLLKKKVTIYNYFWVKPTFYMVAPMEMTPGGMMGYICVGPEAVANPTAGCTDGARVAAGGAMLAKFDASIPTSNPELLAYLHVMKQSGWTVFAFMLLTFFVVAGAGLLMAAGSGTALGGTAAAGFGGGTGITASGAMMAGAAAAGAYGLVATAFLGHSLTDVQDGLLGSINSGIEIPEFTDDHSPRIAEGIRAMMLLGQIDSGSVHPAIAEVYNRLTPNASTPVMFREVSYHRERWVECKQQGKQGQALHECAAGFTN